MQIVTESTQKSTSDCTLEELLLNQNIVLLEFLGIKNIHSKIKTKLKLFVKYCQKNQDFSNNLIDIGIKCPMHQGSSQAMKSICYIASDVLSCDQDLIADLFILPSPQKKCENNSSDQQNQIYENIVLQTQETSINQKQSQQKQQNQLTKYKYLLRMLSYIQQQNHQNIDQSCLNYLMKSMACILRNKLPQLFYLFKIKAEILDNLFRLTDHTCVNQFFIKIVSEEEMEQDHNEIKKFIINSIAQKFKFSINEESFVDRLDFIDELFQSNKYSANNDQKSQLQIISEIFVSKQMIDYFFRSALEPKSCQQYYNSLSYLGLVVKRMNVDEEIDPFDYSKQQKEPTMDFYADDIFVNFCRIVSEFQTNILNNQSSEDYKNKLLRTKIYQVLSLLCKSLKFKNSMHKRAEGILVQNFIIKNRSQKVNILKQLINQFASQKSNGINRFNILFIIQKVLALRIYQNAQIVIIKKKQSDMSQKDGSMLQKKTAIDDFHQENVKQIKSQLQEIKTKVDGESQCNSEDIKKRKQKFLNLKLNIKKPSQQQIQLQSVQAAKKQQLQIQQMQKNQQNNSILSQEQLVLKRQVHLTKDQVNGLIKYLDEVIKKNSNFTKINNSDTQKKTINVIQWFALANKLIILICNSINPHELSQKVTDELKNRIQKCFSFFNIQNIQKLYSTKLGYNTHPNGKIRFPQQFEFVERSMKIFKLQEKQKQQLLKPKIQISQDLSDCDFRSDDQDGPILSIKSKLDALKQKNINQNEQNKNPQSQSQDIQNSSSLQVNKDKSPKPLSLSDSRQNATKIKQNIEIQISLPQKVKYFVKYMVLL